MSSSNGSTLTVGAGPGTDECRQAYLQGESAAVWSVELGSMQQEGLGFEWEWERVNNCPSGGMRRREDIDFAGSDLQNLEEGGLGLGTGSPRPQRPQKPACCKVTEGCGQSLRLASARCWRTTVVEAAAAGGRELRTASRPVGRAEGRRRESGGRCTRARETGRAMLGPADCGRERSEVAGQIEWGSRGVGAVDAADVFAVEIELELELQLELEVCPALARRGEEARRLRSTSKPNPSCRPILSASFFSVCPRGVVLWGWTCESGGFAPGRIRTRIEGSCRVCRRPWLLQPTAAWCALLPPACRPGWGGRK